MQLLAPRAVSVLRARRLALSSLSGRGCYRVWFPSRNDDGFRDFGWQKSAFLHSLRLVAAIGQRETLLSAHFCATTGQ